MLPAPFRAMDPADHLAWLAVADWLEENGETDRAELVRLTRLLRFDVASPDRLRREDRLMELLAAGVEPCVATLMNSIGMEFVYIPAGTFLMGSPEDEADRSPDEGPVHEVTITKAFHLGIYQVTQGEYQEVMGVNPSRFSAIGRGKAKVEELNTNRFPVEQVCHEDAVKFFEKLSGLAKEKQKKRLYHLPTEAEWEYACRGGLSLGKQFHIGNKLTSNDANFGDKLGRTSEVGSYKKPNAFGLYDMHGNVWEWCSDWYDNDYYRKRDKVNPTGPSEGSNRVIRGGGWYNVVERCSAGFRSQRFPESRSSALGFRLLLSSPIE